MQLTTQVIVKSHKFSVRPSLYFQASLTFSQYQINYRFVSCDSGYTFV